MRPDTLDGLKWFDASCRWQGLVEIRSGRLVPMIVYAGRRDPGVSLALARLAWPMIQPRVDDASVFASGKLLEYCNVFNAHLRDGEQLSAAQFASRLEFETIEFTAKGSATLLFRHSLYRGQNNLEGGMVVVKVRSDGTFAKASWMTAADSDEWRRLTISPTE